MLICTILQISVTFLVAYNLQGNISVEHTVSASNKTFWVLLPDGRQLCKTQRQFDLTSFIVKIGPAFHSPMEL